MRALRRVLLPVAAVAGSVLFTPAAAWASHGIAGTPDWMIPWRATAVLMFVPYLALAAVGAVVYRLLRREFGGH